MDNYLEELWQKTLRLIRNEITDVSFDTWIKAVSYTHLRNPCSLLLCLFFGWYVLFIMHSPLSNSILNKLYLTILPLLALERETAVSYTHLDVYKRQAWWPSVSCAGSAILSLIHI